MSQKNLKEVKSVIIYRADSAKTNQSMEKHRGPGAPSFALTGIDEDFSRVQGGATGVPLRASRLPADRVVTPALPPGSGLPGLREVLLCFPLQPRGWGSASLPRELSTSGVFTGQSCPLVVRCSMPCAQPSRASWGGGDTCPAQPPLGLLRVSYPVLCTSPHVPATPST